MTRKTGRLLEALLWAVAGAAGVIATQPAGTPLRQEIAGALAAGIPALVVHLRGESAAAAAKAAAAAAP